MDAIIICLDLAEDLLKLMTVFLELLILSFQLDDFLHLTLQLNYSSILDFLCSLLFVLFLLQLPS
jgi:hypothetical protein